MVFKRFYNEDGMERWRNLTIYVPPAGLKGNSSKQRTI